MRSERSEMMAKVPRSRSPYVDVGLGLQKCAALCKVRPSSSVGLKYMVFTYTYGFTLPSHIKQHLRSGRQELWMISGLWWLVFKHYEEINTWQTCLALTFNEPSTFLMTEFYALDPSLWKSLLRLFSREYETSFFFFKLTVGLFFSC